MNIEDFLVFSDMTVLEAMSIINRNTKGIVFVCEGTRLVGTVTDGDIRRFILKGGDLSERVEAISNKDYLYLKIDSSELAKNIMEQNFISAIPFLNCKCEIVSIYFDDGSRVDRDILKMELDIPLIIMAGGKGTRLKPFTDILPKPLIPIGEKTITEHIIDKFVPYGCKEIYLIVNYKKEFIKAYFQEERYAKWIYFVDEPFYLGTGGGIKLLENRIDKTFFVSNCDILLDVDYRDILRYHKEEANIITMVCAKKKFTIPYGTISIDERKCVTGITEKPSQTCLVNTGVYILEPEVMHLIPQEKFVHITEIITKCIERKQKVGTLIIKNES